MKSENIMPGNAAFLTTAHTPYSERIFYHQAPELHKAGYRVSVISSFFSSEKVVSENGIRIIAFDGNIIGRKEKTTRLLQALKSEAPDIIICSEPMAIHAARQYNRLNRNTAARIIYDITEWFPSYKHLKNKTFIKKLQLAVTLFFFNLYESAFADGFIFGEKFKRFPYKILFPAKKNVTIPYYPDLSFFEPYTKLPAPEKEIIIGFTGNLSPEKGSVNFLHVLEKLHELKPALRIRAILTGFFPADRDLQIFRAVLKNLPGEIQIEQRGWLPFREFNRALSEAHIYLDLRIKNAENNHVLPIKIFYYAAAGRPVIYSDLKAVREQTEIQEFGFLADPGNAAGVAALIIRYTDEPGLYQKHCKQARELAEKKYNWDRISSSFLTFVNSF